MLKMKIKIGERVFESSDFKSSFVPTEQKTKIAISDHQIVVHDKHHHEDVTATDFSITVHAHLDFVGAFFHMLLVSSRY